MKTAVSRSVVTTPAQEDKRYWERHIKEQRVSGISRASYCRINRVNYNRFAYWIRNMKSSLPSTAVIPILVKPEINDEAITNGSRILCTLKFRNGVTVSVHDREALCLLLKEMM